jgi:hypothetical protein
MTATDKQKMTKNLIRRKLAGKIGKQSPAPIAQSKYQRLRFFAAAIKAFNLNILRFQAGGKIFRYTNFTRI